MSPDEIQLFGYRIFASKTLLVGWLVFWIPATLLILPIMWKCVAAFVVDARKRRRWILLCIASLVTAPWWGVIPLSIEANKACREHTGTRVYGTLQVDAFPTNKGIKWAAAHGFKYAVSPNANLEYPHSLWRDSLVNGEIVREQIPVPVNVIDIRRENLRLDKKILVDIDVIFDLKTKMTLAEGKWVTGTYSFFNQMFTFGAFSEGWSCGRREYDPEILMLAVLRPKTQQ